MKQQITDSKKSTFTMNVTRTTLYAYVNISVGSVNTVSFKLC